MRTQTCEYMDTTYICHNVRCVVSSAVGCIPTGHVHCGIADMDLSDVVGKYTYILVIDSYVLMMSYICQHQQALGKMYCSLQLVEYG